MKQENKEKIFYKSLVFEYLLTEASLLFFCIEVVLDSNFPVTSFLPSLRNWNKDQKTLLAENLQLILLNFGRNRQVSRREDITLSMKSMQRKHSDTEV